MAGFDPTAGNANAFAPAGILAGQTNVLNGNRNGLFNPYLRGGAGQQQQSNSVGWGGAPQQGDMPSNGWGPVNRGFGMDIMQGRKMGGPVEETQLYRVGEGGKPELYVPDNGVPEVIGQNGEEIRAFPKDGKIIPHDKAVKIAPKLVPRYYGGGVRGMMPDPDWQGPRNQSGFPRINGKATAAKTSSDFIRENHGLTPDYSNQMTGLRDFYAARATDPYTGMSLNPSANQIQQAQAGLQQHGNFEGDALFRNYLNARAYGDPRAIQGFGQGIADMRYRNQAYANLMNQANQSQNAFVGPPNPYLVGSPNYVAPQVAQTADASNWDANMKGGVESDAPRARPYQLANPLIPQNHSIQTPYGSGSVTFGGPKVDGPHVFENGKPWNAKDAMARQARNDMSFDDVRRNARRGKINKEVDDKLKAGGFDTLTASQKRQLLPKDWKA